MQKCCPCYIVFVLTCCMCPTCCVMLRQLHYCPSHTGSAACPTVPALFHGIDCTYLQSVSSSMRSSTNAYRIGLSGTLRERIQVDCTNTGDFMPDTVDVIPPGMPWPNLSHMLPRPRHRYLQERWSRQRQGKTVRSSSILTSGVIMHEQVLTSVHCQEASNTLFTFL